MSDSPPPSWYDPPEVPEPPECPQGHGWLVRNAKETGWECEREDCDEVITDYTQGDADQARLDELRGK